MNTETTKITAVEVMTTGAEIVKMSANEQLVAYGYLMGLPDRSSALHACRAEEASGTRFGGRRRTPWESRE